MELDDEVTAWHEAGHAMMAVLCGGEIERVTIEPPYDDGPARFGDTVTRWRGLSNRQLVEASQPTVRRLLQSVVDEINQLMDSANAWAAVSAIADDLLAHETLDHEQVAYHVDFWIHR